jgi:L-amino acid N-acyltransferase YncA
MVVVVVVEGPKRRTNGLGWVYVSVTRNFVQNYYTTYILVDPIFLQKTPARAMIGSIIQARNHLCRSRISSAHTFSDQE